MKDKLINIKQLIKGIALIGIYLLLPILIAIPFNYYITNTYIIITYTILSIIYLLIYKKELVIEINDFKNNYKTYLKNNFKYWLIGLIVMITSTLIFNTLGLNDTVNQEQNLIYLKELPFAEIITVLVFAPFIEELVFRKGFKKCFNNKYCFILFTGLTFGFFHIISSLNNPQMILYIIPYGSLGIALSLIYYKTNNIFTSITFHSFHNLLSLLEILILGGLL